MTRFRGFIPRWAYIYLGKEQPEQALAAAERAIALEPTLADGYAARGNDSEPCGKTGGGDHDGRASHPP